MVNSPKTKRSASMPAQAMSLAQWPQRWQCDTPDIAVGERILAHFMAFLPHRLPSGRARNTLTRQRDNLCLLGGELIGRRYDDHA